MEQKNIFLDILNDSLDLYLKASMSPLDDIQLDEDLYHTNERKHSPLEIQSVINSLQILKNINPDLLRSMTQNIMSNVQDT